jgi:hypothetical protein
VFIPGISGIYGHNSWLDIFLTLKEFKVPVARFKPTVVRGMWFKVNGLTNTTLLQTLSKTSWVKNKL